MSLDDKIKQELEKELPNVEKIMAKEQGLFDMLFATFNSSMRGWVIAVNVVTLIVSGLMIWTGYEFFVADDSQQMFWGMCLLICLNAQIALKQWIWSEMRRHSLMREIKRLELAIARLS